MSEERTSSTGVERTLIPQDRLLTSIEVCRILNIRRLRLYEILHRGEIKSMRVGRLHRFLPSTVAEYIRVRMEES